MSNQTDPKLIKASYLVLANLIITLVTYLFQNFGAYPTGSLVDISVSLIVLLVLFFLLRRGYKWTKWVMLIVLANKLFDLYGFVLIIIYVEPDLLPVALYLISTTLFVIATILSFRRTPPNKQITFQP